MAASIAREHTALAPKKSAVKLAQIIFEKCYSNIAVGLPPTALSTAQFRSPENKFGDSLRVADKPPEAVARRGVHAFNASRSSGFSWASLTNAAGNLQSRLAQPFNQVLDQFDIPPLA